MTSDFSDPSHPDPTDASEAGRQLGKLGANKGGRARANVLTPSERSEIARQAVRTRWEKAGKLKPLTSDRHPGDSSTSSVQRPEIPYSLMKGELPIGDFTFECHVLSDGRRVLTQREVVRVISGGRESSNLARYLERVPVFTEDYLADRVIPFRVGPGVAHGYEATLLIEICEGYLTARAEKLLKPSQQRIAQIAEVVVRACAKVGIIALVDEATGYQELRAKQALRIKLQALIADDMQEWAKTFPEDFWIQLARLEGTRYSPRHRPLRWGRYVMMFVYDTIDEDLGRRLREINPNPRHRQNHHQWLKEFGKEKLNAQIWQTVAIMKTCEDMDQFKRRFSKVFNKGSSQLTFDGLDFEWD